VAGAAALVLGTLELFGLAHTLTNERVIADADAYADFLLERPEVRGPAIGAHGYCMGGRTLYAEQLA
jgi:dienelactone hydrolase